LANRFIEIKRTLIERRNMNTTNPQQSTLANCALAIFEFAEKFDAAIDSASQRVQLDKLSAKIAELNAEAVIKRTQIAVQRKAELLDKQKALAIAEGFNCLDDMQNFIDYMPIPEVTKAAPESTAESDTQPKVHPNPKRKVYKFLLIDGHANFTRGHNGSFKGQKPAWAKSYVNGKVIDPTKFRLADADEIAAMEALVQAELDNYKPRKSKGAAALPKP
jgi:hypothetical protein